MMVRNMLLKVLNEFLDNHYFKRYSRNTILGALIAERYNRTIRYLFKNPVILAGNTNWISELPSVIMKYKNTIHKYSTKMTPIPASKKSNEKNLFQFQR